MRALYEIRLRMQLIPVVFPLFVERVKLDQYAIASPPPATLAVLD
jgi:hypothetical protein